MVVGGGGLMVGLGGCWWRWFDGGVGWKVLVVGGEVGEMRGEGWCGGFGGRYEG